MDVIRLDRSVSVPSRRSQKIPGFDALRAFAALAVVMLHAGVPYLHHRMPGLVWSTTDRSSPWVDAIFWSIEVMIMPLFLVIAGFLMWQSAQRVSPKRLVQSRAKRLLIPFAFGLVAILPIDLYLWTIGLIADGVVAAVKLKSLKFEGHVGRHIWGTSHLWFLLYVFAYVALAAMLMQWLSGRELATKLRRWATPTRAVVLLGAIAVITLAIRPEVVWGFQHAFLPVPSKWIYSGAFFAAGYALASYDGELTWVKAASGRSLALAVMTMWAAWMMGTWSLDQIESGQPMDVAASGALALLTVVAAASTTVALMGLGRRWLTTSPRWLRYLAAASFWVYLVHHPLLGLIHIDLKWWMPHGNPLVKMLIAFSGSVALSLASYEVLVRQTRFGGWLGMNGAGLKNSDPKEATIAAPSLDDAVHEPPVRRAA